MFGKKIFRTAEGKQVKLKMYDVIAYDEKEEKIVFLQLRGNVHFSGEAKYSRLLFRDDDGIILHSKNNLMVPMTCFQIASMFAEMFGYSAKQIKGLFSYKIYYRLERSVTF